MDTRKTKAMMWVWLVMVISGMALLTLYSQTPGAPADPPSVWPMASRVPPPGERVRLLMLVHPKCPCSRACLTELEHLSARVGGNMDGYVLFYEPDDVDSDWSKTDLWRTASGILGVRVMNDPEGEEAARFGVKTSGQVLVYAPDGALLFSGGLTPSRGHEGDNLGKSSVLAALQGSQPRADHFAVYGCPIQDPENCNSEDRPR